MTSPHPFSNPDLWDTLCAAYVRHVVPFLGRYADAVADELVPTPRPEVHAVDVACGPGTLALRLAERVGSVDALDFAPGMVRALEDEVRVRGLTNVTARVGDGQAMPFDDDAFDVGASMFGLMFFPDRIRGFRELARVVRPGGRIAVAAWAPAERSALIRAIGAALLPAFPELGERMERPERSLEDLAVFEEEMTAAGLREVNLVEIARPMTARGPEALFRAIEESFGPIVLLRRDRGADFDAARPEFVARLAEHLGPGPVAVDSLAYVGYALSP